MTPSSSLITNLHPFIQEIWIKSNFIKPTSIQREAIPLAMEGKDIIAESPTGTGKTLAYLLPVLQTIDSSNNGIQGVILASSHELVMQIHQEIQNWTKGSDIHSASFIGGTNIKRQVEKLKKKPQIIVATPGRLLELIKIKKVKMHQVKMIVLDEADQLLVPEHKETVINIINSSLSERQVLLFSATLTESTVEAAKEIMNKPEIIKVKEEQTPKVDHIYFVCELRDKIEILRKIIRIENIKAIGFMKDIGNLSVLAQKLSYKGLKFGLLHSDTKKQERANAINGFRDGKFPLLLATDVAARGLDIQGITHVIHIDVPEEVKQYVHRSGRTGRIGSTSGTVISIVTPREERKLKQIANKVNINLEKKIFIKGQIKDASKRSK